MTAKTNKTQKVRRTIGGQQYLFSKTAYGWGVAPAGKRGDISRVHRGYNIYVNDRGEPTRCSCPDYAERSKRGPHICKHMVEVAKMLGEPMTAETKAAIDAAYDRYAAGHVGTEVDPPRCVGGDRCADVSGCSCTNCKAYRATRPIAPPEPAPAPAEHVLVNDAGCTLIYTVNGDRVRIGRRYRGAEVGSLEVPRAHARRHYAAMKIEGFKKP
jgi:hypothetical protein